MALRRGKVCRIIQIQKSYILTDFTDSSTEWVPLLNPGWKNWDERQFGWSYQRDIYIMADVHAYFQICLAVRGDLLSWFSDILTRRLGCGIREWWM